MWNWNYVVELLPTLLDALLVSLYATICGFLLAVVLGLVFTLGKRSPRRWINLITNSVVEFVRRTPLLVQLFFLYFGISKMLPVSMTAFLTGVIGLGVHYATYLSEVYRSCIDALPKGQWEASTALNLSKAKTWLLIILPQAIPPALPLMGNYLIVIFKETPLLSGITVMEMLLRVKNEVSKSYLVFEPYTVIGVFFIVISLAMSLLFNQLEKRIERRHS
ncbi:ectoine/hydroxyectoine ABC transporter permease subunit EhuD [Paenibacillus chungangensis]|uniref:Ectoine/hydroxyectoine ABC transporter permease subunit EhuD n=1 Tax=Paenibacillus chungangensis TaxID=696535 RepID=A0ABW3HND9_9BACL